ncbi:MAG: NAD kinase [Candidatus Azobacteroides sp.]|nr:NAD kinase [Candidatus Azobacteroides sp.]
MRIVIFSNTYSSEKFQCITPLVNFMEKSGVEMFVDKSFYEFISQKLNISLNIAGLINEKDDFDGDIAFSIGGDGTFLKTATRIGRKEIPILGINTGRLGFLADVASNEVQHVLPEILNKKYTVENRSLLKLSTNNKSFHGYNYALNEVAVLKFDHSSMITIHAYIDNNYLNSYQADGLIISTPTGSTAYSMSVGGPIIEPTAANFVISPIAPHSLNARPLVITDNSIITLRMESRKQKVLISLDGRSEEFDREVVVTIQKADFHTRVVKRLNHTFYDTIRTKLMWGMDSR